jgi:hypothetical protein
VEGRGERVQQECDKAAKKIDEQLHLKLESAERKARIALEVEQTALEKERVKSEAKARDKQNEMSHAKEMAQYRSTLSLTAARERIHTKEEAKSQMKNQTADEARGRMEQYRRDVGSDRPDDMPSGLHNGQFPTKGPLADVSIKL